MSEHILCNSLPVPESIQFRYCPKDWGHWRSRGERCPVCGSKISVVRFVPERQVSRPSMSWEEIERLYDAGFSYPKMEELSGVRWKTIQTHMNKVGKPRRKRGTQVGQQKISDEDINAVVTLYHDERLSINDVGDRLGLKQGAVRRRLWLAGRPARSRSEANKQAHKNGKREGFQGNRVMA